MKPGFLLLCCLLFGFVRPAARAGTEEPAGGRVVELPPLLVTGSRGSLNWRYGEAPGLEVLSLCPNGTTEDFMAEFQRLRQLLRVMVPESLQSRYSVPVVHLLCGSDMQGRLSQDVLAQMFQARPAPPDADPVTLPFGRDRLLRSAAQVHVMPNLRLQDDDAYTIFALLDDDLQHPQLALTPDYVNFLLQRRQPPLPPWFTIGTLRVYAAAHFGEREVDLAPAVWISEAATKAARKSPAAAAAVLLPVADLLVAPHPVAAPPEAAAAYRGAWVAQAALLVRWGLDERTHGQRDAFFRFVEHAAAQPVTEALLQADLGLGFAQLQGELARYLPKATDGTARLLPSDKLAPLDLNLRRAAPADVARLKGDWERMETAYVKPGYPTLSATYLAEARRTFHRAYDAGERDPRLLAAMGLLACDAGDDAGAEPLLTAAVQAGVVRPRAYAELARIRYAAARAHPAGAAQKLDAAQTAFVLHPLLADRRQEPALAAGAELMGDLWFHTDMTPLPSDLAALDEDTRRFPKSVTLGYRTALLEARAGLWPSARRLIERGEATAPNADVRAAFARLESLRPRDGP